MALLGGGIYLGVNFAVDRAVKVDAEQKAAGWADYFIDTMPGLDDLLVSGTLNDEQWQVVHAAESLGDVFRFKLFDRNGGIALVSDEAAFNAEAREKSDKALGVIRTGISNISVNDGTGKQNRPPLYAEAYVPMLAPDGSVVGIVEVYIDQTATAALFRNTFAALAIGLAVIAALAFGLPTLAFLLRSRQASESRQRADFLARHDPMTGLLNRSSFNVKLADRLALPDRAKGLAVAFFDVDGFKATNDAYGHEAGDDVLKHVARAISINLSEAEFASRIGGDEFVVAFEGRGNIVETVETIMQAVREPIASRGKAITTRISVGVHAIEGGAADAAEVMNKADVALFQAKIDGGNVCRMFSEGMAATMRQRKALEALIREATADKRFELYYQPLLVAETKRCAGFEALLRLPDGKGGFVPPSQFIPVAEAMGLINEIGHCVIDRATRAAASWPDDLFVAVNLSVKQFHDGQLVDHVRAALERTGLKSKRLELEVTESMLMENTEAIAEQLAALRALGVSIAMDDFGTGYSSLGYLWQFGFDKLKIDRSFISALDVNDKQARDILDTIIMLGHKLDMSVTAEGIETENQANILFELACDHFQGFLYGRPAPEAEIAAFLLANVADATRVSAEMVAKRA
jgi:diguanylate cyclase (GGDEF)-like protein